MDVYYDEWNHVYRVCLEGLVIPVPKCLVMFHSVSPEVLAITAFYKWVDSYGAFIKKRFQRVL